MTAQSDKAAIRGVIERIDKALYDRDAGAVVAGFAADARLFDLAPPLSRKIKVEEVAAWLDTWEGPVTRETRDLEITLGGELAFAHGYFRTSALTKDGGARAEWWSRATLCFTRRAGKWLISHEHTSVPFYMDGSFRAAIDLEPWSNASKASGRLPPRAATWSTFEYSFHEETNMSELRYPNESREYRDARDALLKDEQELVDKVKSVAEKRRNLPPGGQLKEDYVFQWANDGKVGKSVKFSELFADKNTLLLYSFMFGPNWDNPCPSCTSLVDGFDRAWY